MAFSAKWITASGTVNLSDGAPFKLDDGRGIGAAEVRNLWERGPQQDGVSDLGYRIEPRTATLGIYMAGTSQAHLDSLRGSMQYHFSPRQALGTLQITRDDGEVREIYARRSGPLDIPLVQADRAGKLHKTAIQLFAPDPAWTEPTAVAGTLSTTSSWWLAFDTIGSAHVLEHNNNVGTAQAWTYAGTITAGNPWMIAVRSGYIALDGTIDRLFRIGTAVPNLTDFAQETDSNYRWHWYDANLVAQVGLEGSAMMAAGTHNYFFVMHGNGTASLYRDNALIAQENTYGPGAISHPTRIWRPSDGNGWGASVPYAAVYDILPSPAQRAALHTAMEREGSAVFGNVVYEGDLPEYPVIRINGPISDPVLTNTTTGETLDFTGHTIGSADFYTIDLRYGSKTVQNSGGDNKIGQLSSDSDRASFHIEPAPVAPGGTNVFSLTGTATGTATSAVITYYNRFGGW